MSRMEKKLLLSKLPPKLPSMPPPGPSGKRKVPIHKKKDYSPVYWDKYFDTEDNISVSDSDIFRVYTRGTSGPVLLLLHGGGHSALSWALFASLMTNAVECQCLAVDLRGHGDTKTSNNEDLSAETLSSDIGNLVKTMFGDDPPPVILIGHSMGGAIAVHTAFRSLLPSLVGLAVIDVVEGTALDSLSSMQSFLTGRPQFFKSLDHVIEWAVRSGQIRNIESAKVSMIGQVKRVDTSETASAELEHLHTINNSSTIMEEDEDVCNSGNTSTDEFKKPKAPDAPSHQYTWRIDLSKTDKYWPGWFSGLSNLFLSCPVPKLLLLAGIDRLDRELTVGQMQGKFQMQVLPQCGHVVHEDVPDKVVDVVASFLVRHQFAEPTENFNRTFPAC